MRVRHFESRYGEHSRKERTWKVGVWKKKPAAGTLVSGLIFLICILPGLSCRQQTKDTLPMEHASDSGMQDEMARVPDWHKNATIYEVNLRHYTPEGTFKAFEAHIPRLREMGVDILWLMPVHPVGARNRKGELGSPYSVADFNKVNPDFGSMADFRHLLQTIHEAGMYCIIDWVPHHTAWDHPWLAAHPEWYSKDAEGEITDPINPETGEPWGWTDVAHLNYEQPEMREAMIGAMAYWVEDIGVDGFRVDVAHGVPPDFWKICTDRLYAIKPLFMLAEAEVPALVNNGSFVMDYGWDMHHILNGIARGQGVLETQGKQLIKGNLTVDPIPGSAVHTALDIDRQLAFQKGRYKRGYKMYFTSNHDENAWSGSEFRRFGAGHKAFAVLMATLDGMPLIYSGQESAVDKQFHFFKKDEIPWGSYPYAGFYSTLFDLKHRNRALWNGTHGGPLVKIPTGRDDRVYAFIRQKEGDRVVVILNLSASEQQITLQGDGYAGSYRDVFNQQQLELKAGMPMELKPWEYVVLEGIRPE